MFDLTGKRALVTGSSRGIGRAIALALAEAGADVIIHCTQRKETAAQVSEQIVSMGRRSFVIQKNLMDEDCAEVIWREVEKTFGAIDILVLNASIQYSKPWETITAQDFDEQMSVNVRSSMLLIQKAVPAMKEQHWGRILAIGSVQVVKPLHNMLVYASSKAAQTLMIQTLAVQLAPFGITCNNLAPGIIDTERNARALSDPERAQRIADSIPVRFYGQPEDCAGAALLFCSEEGRYITAQNLYVDGGKCM